MNKTIRVLIADDYPLFREGLRLLLSQFKHIEVCGESGDGEMLLATNGRKKTGRYNNGYTDAGKRRY
ncbi:MAG: hypothetical protein WDO71_22795 [Bacteroidota bacterium]